jgi:hypothetical protein
VTVAHFFVARRGDIGVDALHHTDSINISLTTNRSTHHPYQRSL